MSEERMSILEKFTERAKRVVVLAQEEARRLSSSVGPEHLLLGIATEQDGIGGHVLGRLGVTLDMARGVVESVACRRKRHVKGRPVKGREVPFSEDGKRALRFALEEARRLKHGYVGTEHLLLGLFRLEGGPIVNVIGRLRLTHKRVQDLVIQYLATALHQRQLWGEKGARSNVVMCRVNDRDLEAIDFLIEAGIRTTRSDAAGWLISAGIEGNKALFDKLHHTAKEIRHLRDQAKEITRQMSPETAPPEERRPPEGESPTR